MTTAAEAAKMTVPELKKALTARGLPTAGKKEELVARIVEALASTAAAAPAEGKPAADAAATEVAAAAAPADTAAAGQPEAKESADAAAAENSAPTKHARIVFSDVAAVAPTKIEVIKPAAAAEAKKPAVTEADKAKQRAERFGVVSEADKAKQRAQRFNLEHPELEKEKAIKRAERFGIDHPALVEKKKEERAARFGIVKEEDKLKQRMERFKALDAGNGASGADSADFEARKKARAERFA